MTIEKARGIGCASITASQDASALDRIDDRPVVDLLDVLKDANPLIVCIPVDATPETQAALAKLTAADLKR